MPRSSFSALDLRGLKEDPYMLPAEEKKQQIKSVLPIDPESIQHILLSIIHKVRDLYCIVLTVTVCNICLLLILLLKSCN